MRIVVAPDKFKGTLSAVEAARAMAAGARAAHQDAEVVLLPMGDGGEGSLAALLGAVGGDVVSVTVEGPVGDPVEAPLAFLADGRVFIEAAAASGLSLIGEPSPLHASTRGVGRLIVHALARARNQIVVGVGGTASTDGGTGAAAVAGWRFLDAAGRALAPGGATLGALASIDGGRADERLGGTEIVAACDVANRLNGAGGAARVFSPQKGARRNDARLLAAGLERLTTVVRRDLGVDLNGLPYGGAGGGLGAGLHAFFGARLTSGFGLIASAAGLRRALDGCDVVITGEGRLDATTAEGKVVAGVVDMARSASVECAVVAGEIAPGDGSVEAGLGVRRAAGLVERFGRERALGDARACVAEAVESLLRA